MFAKDFQNHTKESIKNEIDRIEWEDYFNDPFFTQSFPFLMNIVLRKVLNKFCTLAINFLLDGFALFAEGEV